MSNQRGRPPRNDVPPTGATMDLYEAIMMQMVASRVIEAYKEEDRSRQIERPVSEADRFFGAEGGTRTRTALWAGGF